MKLYFTTLAAVVFSAISLRAQTVAFTYQGVLNNGSNVVTGAYDFRFRIYNAGSAVVAGPLTNAPVGVTNGLFTVLLNFNTNVFDGSLRTLEIGVRVYVPNDNTNAYAVLSPRQALTAVPYAIQALNASNAVALTAPLSTANLTGTIPNSLLSAEVAILTNNVVFAKNVTAASFTGNGSGLTNLPATNLVGTIPDARLSTNVAMLNATNAIFSSNVTAVLFAGSGNGLYNVPGAMFWMVATNNATNQPNTGYICTNNLVPVRITLPSSPVLRDVYKVAGVGAGGWVIAQNASQTILFGNLSASIGQNWKVVPSSSLNWSALASSADGTKLTGTVYGGSLYTSADSGATWAAHNSSPLSSAMGWSSVASSADGTKLVATVGYTAYGSTSGYIYTSTDSGTNWTLRNSAPVNTALAWSSVASSADGTRLVAVAYGDQIYTSANSGATWAKQTASGLGARNWTCVASSADGTKLVAGMSGGYLYTSTNSGTNWVAQTGSGDGSQTWATVASSSDGVNLVAATSGSGQVYTSGNSGATWTAQTVATTASASWSSVASSSDGSRLAAVYNATLASGGCIFTSDNFGATWIQRNGAPTVAWSAIACSADGSQWVATASTYHTSGGIYISSQSRTTVGTAGYLVGAQNSAIELIYVGNGTFLPLSHEGTIRAY